MGLGKFGVAAASLAVLYSLTGVPLNYPSSIQRYSLPSEIVVTESTVPYALRLKPSSVLSGKEVDLEKADFNSADFEKVVKTKDIDFSGHFSIKTDRYRFVKSDDNIFSRTIGKLGSLPSKLYFWDTDMGKGLDMEKSREVLSMLENDKNIKDLTVRVNHTEAFYDWYRMMNDKELKERNPAWYRLVFGTMSTAAHEVFAEFGRGDYYNALTKTAVVYSNVESIPAHEIGHHIDFSRFDTDWIYSLAGILPPVTLYKEARASLNAKDLLSGGDQWQLGRFLFPAFATYALMNIQWARSLLRKRKKEQKPEE